MGKRRHGTFAGKWEFPGGKVEPGETPEACLKRELAEELGVEAQIGAFFAANTHAYPHATVELLCYHAEIASDAFILHDHSAIEWVNIDCLRDYDVPDADRPIIEKLMTE
jgi:8-oxo-dGTP diphosphatase